MILFVANRFLSLNSIFCYAICRTHQQHNIHIRCNKISNEKVHIVVARYIALPKIKARAMLNQKAVTSLVTITAQMGNSARTGMGDVFED